MIMGYWEMKPILEILVKAAIVYLIVKFVIKSVLCF